MSNSPGRGECTESQDLEVSIIDPQRGRFLNLIAIAVQLLSHVVSVLPYSKMDQPYNTHISLPFGLPSQSDHHNALSKFPVLCSIFSLVVYFIHSINKIVYMCQPRAPSSSHPPSPLWYPYICSLYLYIYFCFANKMIYTIFLDSTYMC